MVIQLTMFDGMWTRKISHSARPGNKSSRRSRSPGLDDGTRLASAWGAAGSWAGAWAGDLARDLAGAWISVFTGEPVDSIMQGAAWRGGRCDGRIDQLPHGSCFPTTDLVHYP